MSQLVGNFRVSRFQRVESARLIKPSASRLGELVEILFTLVQHSQPLPQILNSQLIKSHSRVRPIQQGIELSPLRRSRNFSIRDDVDGHLRSDQSLQCSFESRSTAAVVDPI